MFPVTEKELPIWTPEADQILRGLPRNQHDESIIEGSRDDIPLQDVLPLVRKNVIKAVFIYESAEEEALRHEFNQKCLTPNLWQQIAAFHKNREATSSEVSKNNIMSKQAAGFYNNPTHTICFETMRDQFDMFRLAFPKIDKTSAIIFAHTKDANERGSAPRIHRDRAFPVVAHKTITGGALRFLKGYLSEEERKQYFKEETSTYTGEVSEDRIEEVPENATAFFGITFLHQSSPKIPEQGQLAISSTSLAL